MSNLECPIPPLNRQVQKKYMIMSAEQENPSEARTVPKTTPLRWLLDKIEKKLLLHTITERIAENTSDFEAFCPVCLEDYITPGEDAISGSGKACQLNEKPLKLHCGHVLGHRCFYRIMSLPGGGVLVHKCPLCRSCIYTFDSHPPLLCSNIPLIHEDGQWDIFVGLCCAIRLFICINLTQPETHEALYEWVHSPLLEQIVLEGQTQEEVLYIAIMRWAVDGYCREQKAWQVA